MSSGGAVILIGGGLLLYYLYQRQVAAGNANPSLLSLLQPNALLGNTALSPPPQRGALLDAQGSGVPPVDPFTATLTPGDYSAIGVNNPGYSGQPQWFGISQALISGNVYNDQAGPPPLTKNLVA